ncbi:metalloprotease [Dimargaris verticillata]|uniref:Metalloprotease n=1 Tax=Dimargaris verticillata TaxID=2761393 RepID=A0A9W8E7H2_9FUNG|nr:metalloprotease [Dimargaris verticillata]
MALAVYGRESLDQLTEWVVTKFSGVVNKDTPYPQYHQSPWKAEHLQRRINIEAAQSTRELTLVFPTADAKPQYDCNPVHYLSCLIGHEGSGSLLSYLKKRGWAIGLGAGSCLNDVIGFDAFSINIELTPAGLEHIEDMVVVVFEYIAMLKHVGPQEYYFNFLRDMSGIEFRFQPKPDPQSYCIGLATTLRHPWLRPEHLLVGRGVVREYIPAQIEAFLQQLAPDNMYYMVQAKELQLVDPLVEEHYGTNYELVPLTLELRNRLAHLEPNDALQMPPPNAFVPEDLTVHCVKRDLPVKEPTLLVEQGSNRLWHKQDDTFGLPRGRVHVHLKSSICQSHPYNAVRFSLLMDMFEDALNEFFYDASEAGLRGSRDRIDDGLVLRFWGFNDKLPLFIQQTLQHFITFVPQQSRFKIIKEDQQRHLKDYRHAPSNSHAINDRKHLLRLCDWTNDECLAALEHVTLPAVQQFHREFLLRLGAETLVLGNFTEQQALDVAQTVLDALDVQVLCPDEESNNRSIVLTSGQQFIHQRQHPDPKQENAAISFLCAIGLETDRVLRAQVTLMDNIISEPFFDQLRTKETLGYIVWSRSIYQLSGQMSFEFVVQSERNPMYLESRIYAFLDKMLEILEKMPEDQFEKHKRAVIAQKREKPKALGQETGRYWGRIQDLTFEFDKAETEIRYLSQLTHASLVAFYKRYLHPASPHFAKLSCHIVPHKQAVTPPYLISMPDCVDIVPNAASAMEAGAYPHSVALLGLHAYLAHHQIHPSLSELKALARDAQVVDEKDTPAIEAFMTQVAELYYQPPPTKSTTTADKQVEANVQAEKGANASVVGTMKKEGVMASFFRPSAQLLGDSPQDPVAIEMPSPRANGLQLPDNNFIMFSSRAFRISQRLSSDVFPARKLTPKYPGYQWKAKLLSS